MIDEIFYVVCVLFIANNIHTIIDNSISIIIILHINPCEGENLQLIYGYFLKFFILGRILCRYKNTVLSYTINKFDI